MLLFKISLILKFKFNGLSNLAKVNDINSLLNKNSEISIAIIIAISFGKFYCFLGKT